MFPETDALLQEIRQNGYAEVPAPLIETQIKTAADSFLDFLALPEDFKIKFKSVIKESDGEQRAGAELGYLKKTNADGTSDNKRYFHYHPIAERDFKELLDQRNPIVDSFFENSRLIYSAATTTAYRLLKGLDRDFPGVHQQFFDGGLLPGMLRFLAYDVASEGEIIGAEHSDIGALTLGISESGPGLEAKKDELWTPAKYNPNTWLFFRGKQEVPELESMEPLLHRVVHVGKNYSPEVARWAIVCFIDSKNYPLRKPSTS